MPYLFIFDVFTSTASAASDSAMLLLEGFSTSEVCFGHAKYAQIPSGENRIEGKKEGLDGGEGLYVWLFVYHL